MMTTAAQGGVDIGRLTRAVSTVVTSGSKASASDLVLLFLNSAVLCTDSRVACDHAALANTLWDILDAVVRRSESAAVDRVAFTRMTCCVGVLGMLYRHRALKPSKPDVTAAIAASGAIFRLAATQSPIAIQGRAACGLAAVLAATVSGADLVAVANHFRDVVFPGCARLPAAVVRQIVGSLSILCERLAVSETHRGQIAALLTKFASDVRFTAPLFASSDANAGTVRDSEGRKLPPGAPAAAPHALNCLHATHKALFDTTLAARQALSSPGLRQTLDDTLREAVMQARTRGVLSTLHLALAAGMLELPFLVAAVQRFVAPKASDTPSESPSSTAVLVALPFSRSVDTTTTGLFDSVAGSKAALAAALLYHAREAAATAKGPSKTHSTASQDHQLSDEVATGLVDVLCESVLRVAADTAVVSDEVLSKGPSAGACEPGLVHAVGSVVTSSVVGQPQATARVLERLRSTAMWCSSNVERKLRTRASQAAAQQGYLAQAAFKSMLGAIGRYSSVAERAAREANEPTSMMARTSNSDRSPAQQVAQYSALLSATDAVGALEALAQLQPVCLVHRSWLPKTAATRSLSVSDWVSVRGVGGVLMELVAASAKDHAGYLRSVRARTQPLPRTLFGQEELYFLVACLNNKSAVHATSFADAVQLWAPTALKCVLGTENDGLRLVGHTMLAGLLLERHPASLRLFPTYVNLYVSCPTFGVAAAADSDEGYGLPSLACVKRFKRSFRGVCLAVESLDAPHDGPSPQESAASAKDTAEPLLAGGGTAANGAAIVKWGVGQLAAVCGYYLSLRQPSKDEMGRRTSYFMALLDTLQASDPDVLAATCTAVEGLLLQLSNPAEGYSFLEYASSVVQAGQSQTTKRSMAAWLLNLQAKLNNQRPVIRSKL